MMSKLHRAGPTLAPYCYIDFGENLPRCVSSCTLKTWHPSYSCVSLSNEHWMLSVLWTAAEFICLPFTGPNLLYSDLCQYT